MIDPAVRIDGFSAAHLSALFRFVTEPPAGARLGDPRRGVVLLVDADRPAALLDLHHAAFEPPPAWLSPASPPTAADLRRLRRERPATWAVSLGAPLLHRLDLALSRSWSPTGDLLDDLWPLVAEIRSARSAGEFLFSPALLDGVPIPSPDAVRSVVDLLWPDDTCLVVAALEDRQVAFGAAALRRGRRVIRVAGPAVWAPPVPDPAGPESPLRSAATRILANVRRDVGTPSLGVFAHPGTLRALAYGTAEDGLAHALARRTLVIDPLPPWLAVIIGADTAVRAAGQAGRLLRRLDPLGLADRLDLAGKAGRLGERLGRDVPWQKLLGFDPVELVARLQRWEDA